jgi:hypothetical protein
MQGRQFLAEAVFTRGRDGFQWHAEPSPTASRVEMEK